MQRSPNKLTRFDPVTKKFREWKIAVQNQSPLGTVVDSAGYVWFIRMIDNQLIRFDPDTAKTKSHDLPKNKGSQEIAIDGNDNIWIVQKTDNRLIRFDAKSGVFQTFSANRGKSKPNSLAVGPNNEIWFSQTVPSQIAAVDVVRIGKIKSSLKVKIKPPTGIFR